MSRSHRKGLPCVALAAMLAITCCTGCPVTLSSEFLSGMVLNPGSSCQQIAQQLNLGPIVQASTPQDVGLLYQPITFTSANSAKLSGWLIPAQRGGVPDANPLGTVLVSHGTDGAIPCAIPWGAVAALNRFHVVLFDYQGFGDSEGSPNVDTLLDDSEAALEWIISDSSAARQKVHLLGVSLGTGASFALAALRDRPQIQSLLVDGAYDPQQEIDAVASSVSFIFPLAGQSAQSAFPWMFEMRASLGNVRVPVMFIIAELDGITPASGAHAMSLLLPSVPANMWQFNALTHVQSLFLHTDIYTSLAVTFWRNPTALANPNATQSDASIEVPVLAP